MGKFPVIFISLKEAAGADLEEAKGMLRKIIGKGAWRFQFLMQSDNLTEIDRRQYRALVNVNVEFCRYSFPDIQIYVTIYDRLMYGSRYH